MNSNKNKYKPHAELLLQLTLGNCKWNLQPASCRQSFTLCFVAHLSDFDVQLWAWAKLTLSKTMSMSWLNQPPTLTEINACIKCAWVINFTHGKQNSMNSHAKKAHPHMNFYSILFSVRLSRVCVSAIAEDGALRHDARMVACKSRALPRAFGSTLRVR